MIGSMRAVVLAGMVAVWMLAVPSMGNGEAGAGAAGHVSTLRVGLWTLWHDKEITVSADGASAAMRRCTGCTASSIAAATKIRAVDDAVAVNEKGRASAVFLSGAVMVAAHGETLKIQNPLRITAHNGQLVMAVTLPVESYVERVVASESGDGDSSEALKALAVVVRSFALHQAHGHAEYELCDSTHCQLLHWGGSGQRGAAAHAATLATTGETLWFHGQRAAAWFHQNCGGRTATPEEVWPGRGTRTSMPWLASRVDPYCTEKGAREWSASITLEQLTEALGAAGLARPGWKNLTVTRRGESARAVTITADGAAINAEDFRLAVGRAFGWGKILSNWYEISRQGDEFVFHGRGSGHGVGLCQTGAAAMSAQGRNASEILGQYFPGARAADEATGLEWQRLTGKGFLFETLQPADAMFMSAISEALGDAEARSALHPSGTITVRAFRSTPAFRDATLAPGWVAAFTEGQWIATQPLATLAARKLLASVLRHEFLHALVEGQSAPGTPLWLREGLVEVWSGEVIGGGLAPNLRIDEVDRVLAHAETEKQSHEAHWAAGWYTSKLLARAGREQVLEWLRNGLPANALGSVK